MLLINTILMIVLFVYASAQSSARSTFMGERLKTECLDYIYSVVGNDAEVSISQTIKDQTFDETGVSAEFVANDGSLKGNTYLAIEFKMNDRVIRRVQIPVRIKIYKNVPIANRKIMRNDIISNDDIRYDKKEVTYNTDKDFLQDNEIVGSKAKTNIAEGALILKNNIASVKSISRGDKVTVIVQSGAIRIFAQGEALQDGAVGELIYVKREGTQVKLQGKVSSDGSVVIALM